MKKQGVFFLYLLLSVSSISFSQTIKISVQPGEKFKVQMNYADSTVSGVGEKQTESLFDTQNTSEFEIASVATETISLVRKMTRIKNTSSFNGTPFSFDTDNDASAIKDFGKPKNITINLKGIVVDKISAPAKTQFGFGSSPVDETKVGIDLFIPALIGRALKPGDHIRDSVTTQKENYFWQTKGVYTVEKIENGIATLSYQGTQVSSIINESMGMKVSMGSNGKASGEVKIDMRSGMLIWKKTVTDAIVNTTIKDETTPGTSHTVETYLISAIK